MSALVRRLIGYACVAVACTLGVLAWKWPVPLEEQVVYHAVLTELHLEDRVLAVENRTSLSREATEEKFSRDCFARLGASSDLVNAFRDANRHQRTVPRGVVQRAGLALSNRHGPTARLARQVTGSKELSSCLDPGWSNHVRLSRVGFSADGQTAMLFVDFHCALCGYRGFVVLKRSEGPWSVSKECTLSVS